MLAQLSNFASGVGLLSITWEEAGMLILGCILIYLAIAKKVEPLLLLPIGFGMLIANMPLNTLMDPPGDGTPGGLMWYIYQGVDLAIFPPLIFLGIGAMTDFGPLIANPVTILLGAGAQAGIFTSFIGAMWLGFNPAQAGSIGIIGGADGPTAIYLTSQLAPEILGPVAVAAHSYMALVPVIQPPVAKLLTSKEERRIRMPEMRQVSRTEKVLFPVIITVLVGLVIPQALPLVGMLMLGNLMRESGVVKRLSEAAANEVANVVTIFLAVAVGASASASRFFSFEFLSILFLGLAAFAVSTATGVLLAKLFNVFSGGRINPLIGGAGVSAVPQAARVAQVLGRDADPSNFLLMHAMGPNVAGVIGSAVAAGVLLSLLS
ncbi:MAG: sodium ion-translocating decarboxylase subunit beta [Clostridia bacterium]